MEKTVIVKWAQRNGIGQQTCFQIKTAAAASAESPEVVRRVRRAVINQNNRLR
jgi:hypothetical protein